ncbi:MAG TPA: oligosaccharide flippase family protein [Polyangiaceae bacterium]|nr:oligosaccharide flippase family protein [Polyangiaceae bacterium]
MAARSPVLRNALILVLAQLAGAPLALLVNAMMGRYVGAQAFGQIFVASTLARLGFLFVEWGHNGVLPAGVARDRSLAGEFLGTSIVWRLLTAALVCSCLALGSWILGYGARFQLVLALVSLQWLLGTLMTACQDVVKGFERTDVTAKSQLGQQVLSILIVVPTLLLGGRLIAALVSQAVVSALVGAWVVYATLRVGVGKITVNRRALKELFTQGAYFLSFGIAMALQANVDTVLLSKLAPGDPVGWFAAAQKLVSVLLIPATALISALYPTLSRLYIEDRAAYVDTIRQALRGTTVLSVPMAACCALYRDVGIRLFNKGEYGPAGQNMLVLSVLILLVYVSMPLGTALLAAGRQRQWAAVQLLCVVVSLGLDPVLIPWFQKGYGNGGIGVCVAGVVSDVVMVGAALLMVERGIVDRSLVAVVAKALVAGCAMVGLGVATTWLTPFVAAPLTVVAYFAFMYLIGGIHKSELAIAKNAVMRRLSR